jgi:hypothetical protein
VLIACAVSFHVSALPAFLLWLLAPGRINKWLWVSLIAAGCVAALAHFDLFSMAAFIPIPYIHDKVEAYIDFQKAHGEEIEIFGLYFLAQLGITLFLLWRAGAIAPHNRYVYLLIKIMLISSLSLLLCSTNVAVGMRIRDFFGAVSIILFPLLYYTIKPRYAAWAVVVLVALLLFYTQIFRYELILPKP